MEAATPTIITVVRIDDDDDTLISQRFDADIEDLVSSCPGVIFKLDGVPLIIEEQVDSEGVRLVLLLFLFFCHAAQCKYRCALSINR